MFVSDVDSVLFLELVTRRATILQYLSCSEISMIRSALLSSAKLERDFSVSV